MGLLFEESLKAAFEAFLEISRGRCGKVEAGGYVARQPNAICVTIEKGFETPLAAKEFAEFSLQRLKVSSGFFVNQIFKGIASVLGEGFDEAANLVVVDVSGGEVGFVAEQ